MAALNHPTAHSASSTALLVCDLQTMILGMVDEGKKPKLIDATKTLLAAARANGVQIFHCVIDTELDPLPTCKVADRWATAFKPALTANPVLAQEPPEVAAPAGALNEREITVGRRPGHVSALRSNGLTPALLREKYGVTSLVICGISTSGVVLSTVKQASDDDFIVTVVEEACIDPSPELHKLLMEKAFLSAAWVMNLEEAVSVLGSK
ncbi:Isochorismatase-like protein [Mycena alexandri]|uniref:Isochorismatase-like protein n=1 Tax=Mycena alexandri TaxID=1745969 RepID=A0AAD6X6L1_9AGAR|nr:Isochorismatase-like protein [Mycena alexandri]